MRSTSPFFLHPASLLASPTDRANREQLAKLKGGVPGQQIERVDLELRDSDLITGTRAFVSSSHN